MRILGTIALFLSAIASIPQANAFMHKDLCLNCHIFGGRQVLEINNTITPRFPTEVTLLDSQKTIFQESSKLLSLLVITLLVEYTPNYKKAIDEIIIFYQELTQQESNLQVSDRNALQMSFAERENLFDNDPIAKFIEIDLFFKCSLPGGKQVTQKQFQAFVDRVITPRFPTGLTIFEVDRQYKDSKEKIIQEPLKVVKLLIKNTIENEIAINEIVKIYKKQFQQENVLLTVNEEVAVGFDAKENLIANDPIPELIEIDMFFGRNIPGGGQVSQEQFQAFVDRVITPRFPAKILIFDVNGQFQDSRGEILQEPSKVVKLLMEDTTKNEIALDEIIIAYKKQFHQESVLLVVDEDVQVAFDANPITTVPEYISILRLLIFSNLIIIVINSTFN